MFLMFFSTDVPNIPEQEVLSKMAEYAVCAAVTLKEFEENDEIERKRDHSALLMTTIHQTMQVGPGTSLAVISLVP